MSATQDASKSGLKVFVLGPARSGTSITYACMRRVFRLPGRGESHVMPAFQAMLDAFYDYKGRKKTTGNFAFQSLDPAQLETHLHGFVRGFYAGLYPHGGFVDKTPGAPAIRGIPLIRAVFPDARILITKRGGVETVTSHRRKFDSSIVAACRAWTACMDAILWAEANCKDVQVIEQHDMTNRPDVVAEAICTHLGQPRRARQVARFLQENEKQRSSTHDASRALTLADVPWTAEDKETFARLCGDMMRRLDYPM